jgi:hypothetical protein
MVRWVVVGLFVSLVGCADRSDPGEDDAETGGVSGSGGSGSPGGAGRGGSGGSANAGASGSAGSTGGSAGSAGGTTVGCSPMRLTPSTNPNAVLLAGGDNVQSFATVRVGGEHVFYVSGGGGIERIGKTGGTPERVFSDTDVDRPRIRLGADTIYWFRDGTLLSIASDATDGTPTTVASGVGVDDFNDNLLFVDESHAYFWLRATESVHRLDLASAEITPLVSGVSNIAWSVNDGFFYFGDNYDIIRRVPLSGGTPEQVLRPGGTVWTLAVDATGTFIGGDGDVRAAAEAGNIILLSLSGQYIQRLAPSGNRLFFSSAGTMGWVNKDGSACAVLTSSNVAFDHWDHDDEFVYIAQGGRLYRILP